MAITMMELCYWKSLMRSQPYRSLYLLSFLFASVKEGALTGDAHVSEWDRYALVVNAVKCYAATRYV